MHRISEINLFSVVEIADLKSGLRIREAKYRAEAVGATNNRRCCNGDLRTE